MKTGFPISNILGAAAFVAVMGLTTLPAGAEDKEAYAPGLGDFMTAYVQPHHVKLWLAGTAGNWNLAEYEAGELKETFEDVVTYQGTWHKVPVAKLVPSLIYPPLAAVQKAIKAKDGDGFKAAYGQLTNGCDSCHKTAHHDFIVVKVPNGTEFIDQEFKPQ